MLLPDAGNNRGLFFRPEIGDVDQIVRFNEGAAVESELKIIKSKDRSKAGFSVPAKGLYLTRVLYADSTFK